MTETNTTTDTVVFGLPVEFPADDFRMIEDVLKAIARVEHQYGYPILTSSAINKDAEIFNRMHGGRLLAVRRDGTGFTYPIDEVTE